MQIHAVRVKRGGDTRGRGARPGTEAPRPAGACCRCAGLHLLWMGGHGRGGCWLRGCGRKSPGTYCQGPWTVCRTGSTSPRARAYLRPRRLKKVVEQEVPVRALHRGAEAIQRCAEAPVQTREQADVLFRLRPVLHIRALAWQSGQALATFVIMFHVTGGRLSHTDQ